VPLRIGSLSAAVAARVQGANTADLDAIAQRVLTAQTLDEALGTLTGAAASIAAAKNRTR
jgi:hypothetical protein